MKNWISPIIKTAYILYSLILSFSLRFRFSLFTPCLIFSHFLSFNVLFFLCVFYSSLKLNARFRLKGSNIFFPFFEFISRNEVFQTLWNETKWNTNSIGFRFGVSLNSFLCMISCNIKFWNWWAANFRNNSIYWSMKCVQNVIYFQVCGPILLCNVSKA